LLLAFSLFLGYSPITCSQHCSQLRYSMLRRRACVLCLRYLQVYILPRLGPTHPVHIIGTIMNWPTLRLQTSRSSTSIPRAAGPTRDPAHLDRAIQLPGRLASSWYVLFALRFAAGSSTRTAAKHSESSTPPAGSGEGRCSRQLGPCRSHQRSCCWLGPGRRGPPYRAAFPAPGLRVPPKRQPGQLPQRGAGRSKRTGGAADLPALASPLTMTHPTPTKDPGLPDSDKLNAAPPTIPHAAAIPSDPGLPAAGRGPGCPGSVDDAAATA
jgi:hypothetical protein